MESVFQFFQNSKFKLRTLCELSFREPTIVGREGGKGIPNPSSQLKFGPNSSSQLNFGPDPNYQI